MRRFGLNEQARIAPMADYIYLMQNRLTATQRRALEAVREAARTQGMPVFLVGGAVRDLTTGTPVRDLDFALQGDARALLDDLQGRGGVSAGENTSLSSLYLTFPGGVRVEVGPTLSVSYPKPGQPETQSAAILDDLRRRDFTANAMAISLNEGSYGLLLDPLNGIADLENRELRLASAYGFIEQPALLLRAARLTERLGWLLEERTATRYQTSKEEEHISALPAADRAYELEEIFHEEDPVSVLTHMEAEGWLPVLSRSLRVSDADRNALDSVSELLSRMEGRGLHADPSAVNFPLVTAKMSESDRNELKTSFARPGFARQIDTMEARAKELGSQLTSKAAAAPSDVWHLLMQADAEVILSLAYTSRSAAIQGKIKAFLNEWPLMRAKIPYGILQEMRITPELPGYDKLLDDIFFALIDGKLGTDEAIRAFLEPYSPPAPPQVQVRRRPAKATRARGGKKAATVAAEPDPIELGDADNDDDREDEDSPPERDDEDDAETEDDPAPAPPARESVSKKISAKAKGESPSAVTPKVVPASEKAPRAEASEKVPATKGAALSQAKKAGSKEPAKPVEKAVSAKSAPVVVPAAAEKPAKPAAKSVSAAKDSDAKATAAKVVAVKVVAKQPAKATPAKSQPAPTAAKKVAAKEAKAVPAKTSAPVKAVATKGAGTKAAATKAAPAKKGR